MKKIHLFYDIENGRTTETLQSYKMSDELFERIFALASSQAQMSDLTNIPRQNKMMYNGYIYFIDAAIKSMLQQANRDQIQWVQPTIMLEDSDESDDEQLKREPAPETQDSGNDSLTPSRDDTQANVDALVEMQELSSELVLHIRGQLPGLSNARFPITQKDFDPVNNLFLRLMRMDYAAFSSGLTKISPNIDFSTSTNVQIGHYIEAHNKMLSALDGVRKDVRGLSSLYHLISNSSPQFRLLLSVKIDEFVARIHAIDTLLDNFQEKAQAHLKGMAMRVRDRLGEEKYKNSIIVRIWRTKEQIANPRKIAGHNSDGHVTVELYKNNAERYYYGFYVDSDQVIKSNFTDSLLKALHLPAASNRKGFFVTLSDDNTLLKNGYYAECEEIVIHCDRMGAELDLDKAINTMLGYMDKYRTVEVPGFGEAAQLTDYQIYKRNCATLYKMIIEASGAEKYMPYEGVSLLNMDTPANVGDHAVQLKTFTEARPVKNNSEKEKFIQYINEAIEQINLINPGAKFVLGNKMELISFLQAWRESLRLKFESEVNAAIEKFYLELHAKINSFIAENASSDIDNRYGEVVSILKQLSELLPPHEKIHAQIVNRSLDKYTGHLSSQADMFESVFSEMKDICVKAAQNDDLSFFDQSVKYRFALLKLEDKYRLAVNQYKQYCRENSRNENSIRSAHASFSTFKNEYLAMRLQIQQVQAHLRNEMYFKQTFTNTQNSPLQYLKDLLLPAGFSGTSLTIHNVLQNAQSENIWAGVSNSAYHYEDQEQKEIFKKFAFPESAQENNAPSAPSLRAFWNWGKRHQYFELENKAKLFNIVSSDKLNWQAQLHAINKLIENNKPSVFKFWRRAERARYEDMGARAAVICLVQAFSQGQISETRLALEIKKVLPGIAKGQRKQLQDFRKSLLSAYQDYVGANITKTASQVVEQTSHALILKALLEDAVASGNFDVVSFAAGHLKQLLADPQVKQTLTDKQQEAVKGQKLVAPSAKEVVKIEKAFTKRLYK